MHASRYNLVFSAQHDPPYLIMNPLSGAMDFFDYRALALLRTADDPQTLRAYPDFFAHCRDQGYLYPSPQDEERRLDQVRRETLQLCASQPMRVEIYPTLLCNLRCTYCFQSHTVHGSGAIVQPGVIDAMFAAVSEFGKIRGHRGSALVTLFGGEPLLRRQAQRHAVRAILDRAKQRDYAIRIITNGVELAAYADMLVNYEIEQIQVTLDGPQAVHDKRRVFPGGQGSFKYIVQGIDRALERGLTLVVRVNVDAANVASLPQLADFMLHKGWPQRGVAVGVAPVDEFVPESQWCGQETRVETLRTLLEVKRDNPAMCFMRVAYRLANLFESVAEAGRLPPPMISYCQATMGNQISLDYLGNIFACC